ncbi:MAG: hypothetical protein QM639_12730, partial [Rhodocyclaceae bacterium]
MKRIVQLIYVVTLALALFWFVYRDFVYLVGFVSSYLVFLVICVTNISANTDPNISTPAIDGEGCAINRLIFAAHPY